MFFNRNFKSELLRTVKSLRDEIGQYVENARGIAESAVDGLVESTSELSADFLFKLKDTKSAIDDSASKLRLIANLLKTDPLLRNLQAESPLSQCFRIADLKQRRVNIGEDKVVKILLMHVSSPSNFYVHLLDEVMQQFDACTVRLQAVYIGSQPVPNLKPDVGTVWVAREGDNWKRVHVVGFGTEDGQVRVQYLDYGYTAIIDTTRLRHLKRQFLDMPAMAVPCTLAGVYPPQEMITWSDRSTDMFVDIATYAENLAWVYDFQSGPVLRPLQLFIMKEQNEENLTANELLVQCGMASSDYFCQEEPERDCYGGKCQQQQVPETPANEEEVFVNVPEFSVPKPGTILGAHISCVIKPYHFYAIFPNDHEKGDRSMETENMEKLQDDLQREYKRNYISHQFCTLPDLYSIVVFKSQVDGIWYRGRLMSALDDGCNWVVFAIDFGFEQKVRIPWICRPMQRFMHLPAQAVECFLDGYRASSIDDNRKSRELFVRLTRDRFLFAEIVSLEPYLSINLYATNGGKAVNVAEALVNSLAIASE